MPDLRLYLLGSPRLERDGAVAAMDTRKALALLAYLAVTRQEHPRDVLSTLLYPDYDASSARSAFRRTLSTLNTAVGEGVLEIRREAVGLAEKNNLWVDLDEFHHLLAGCTAHGHAGTDTCLACLPLLNAAVDIYQGDFLAGFSLRDSPNFDDWQYLESEIVRRELANALDRLSLGLAAAGDLEGAIEQAHRWSSLDGLNEDAHRRLMLAYAWAGQRNAALRQYRECVRILEQELGVAPLDETTRLYQGITENREFPRPVLAQAAAPARSLAPLPPGPPAAPQPTRYPLVGRAIELDRLRLAYREHGSAGYYFSLEGEAGVGKTALAEEFLAGVEEQGAVVMRFRCYAGEDNLAYAPFVDSLRAATARPSLVSRLAQISPAWLSEAARLAPDLVLSQPTLPPAPPLDGPGANARFYEGVGQFLFGLCDGDLPGVLFLDDLQWADSSSLELLTFLVRRMHGQGVFLLAAWRSEGAPLDPRLRAAAAEAARAGRGEHLHLDRLGEEAVGELVRSRLPAQSPLPAPILHRLYQEAEGLPFFVVEYLAILANQKPQAGENWEIPDSVRNLLHSRLAALDDVARQLLTAAAVIGRSFDFDILHAASGRTEAECVGGLETLTGLGLVKERAAGQPAGPEYDFSLDRLHALVYEETSLARRRLLHRRTVEALTSRRAQQAAGPLAVQVANHALQAGQEALAAEYYRRAGDYARGLYANPEALAAYQSALALGHPLAADLYQDVGDLQTLMGEYTAAINSYEMGAALCRPGCAAQLEYKLANVHQRRGEWDLADSHFQASFEQSGGDAGDPALLARLLADWSRTAHDQGQPIRALELAQRSLSLAQQTGERRSLAQAYNILGILARRAGQPGMAIEYLELSLEHARAAQDLGAQTAALNNQAQVYGDQEDWTKALQLVQSALALCVQQGDRHRQAALLNHLADLYHAAGQPEPAMENLKKAVVLFSEVGRQAGPQPPEIWMLTEW
jgi:DNA-binding SARP family transcriptional activator